ELTALLRNPPTTAAGGEHNGCRVDDVVATAGAPTARRSLELRERRLRKRVDRLSLDDVAQRGRDCVTCTVADLEEPLPRGAAAPREPVAAVLARELHAVLLEPVDRARRLRGEHLDESAVRGLVARLPDVFGVLLGRIVVREGGLDPALRLRGVAGLERSFRREPDPRARPMGGDCRSETRGPAA